MADEGEPELPIIPYRRVTITPKDIQILVGISQSAAYRLYHEIMVAKGRLKHQYITVIDVSTYTGISVEIIYLVLPK